MFPSHERGWQEEDEEKRERNEEEEDEKGKEERGSETLFATKISVARERGGSEWRRKILSRERKIIPGRDKERERQREILKLRERERERERFS